MVLMLWLIGLYKVMQNFFKNSVFIIWSEEIKFTNLQSSWYWVQSGYILSHKWLLTKSWATCFIALHNTLSHVYNLNSEKCSSWDSETSQGNVKVEHSSLIPHWNHLQLTESSKQQVRNTMWRTPSQTDHPSKLLFFLKKKHKGCLSDSTFA